MYMDMAYLKLEQDYNKILNELIFYKKMFEKFRSFAPDYILNLCRHCKNFKPNNQFNCDMARSLYAFSKRNNVKAIIYECPKFIRAEEINDEDYSW